MRSKVSLTTLALAVVLSGCKSGPTEHLADIAPPTLPQGWTTASDPASGTSIGVPSGWQQGAGPLFDAQQTMASAGSTGDSSADPNGQMAQISSAMGQIVGKDAQDQEDKEMAKMREDGVLINVIDSSKPTIGEARTRYYVKKKSYGGSVSLATASADEKSTYMEPGDGTDVVLPIGKAHRFEKQLQLQDGDQQMKISYVLVDGGDAYLIRFISTNSPDVFKSIEQQVAQTFRIKHVHG